MGKPYDYHLEQPRDYVQEDLDRHVNTIAKRPQQGWQCCVCNKGNAPHAVLCGNALCGLEFANVR